MTNRRPTERAAHAALFNRRYLLKAGAGGAALLAAPALLTGHAQAADAPKDSGSAKNAKLDWRQAEGSSITIGVTPAGYFDNLEAVLPTFHELSGINVRLEKTPPGQIRQKAVLDLSAKTGTWASHATDPMYYPLYVANKWIDPLDAYLNDTKLTDPDWFKFDDILKSWREAASINGSVYGIPWDGEITLQVYRTDLYDKLGVKPPETLEEYAQLAAKINDPKDRMWGCAIRGFKGAGQNMYIFPSIFREFGGEWFDKSGKLAVNGPEAVAALEWYVNMLTKYAPSGVANWNWPDIADAFGQGTIASYIDSNTSVAVVANPEKSKVVGKLGFARWPKGPTGKRCTSIWNWSFPINAALSKKDKVATWLFVQWASSREVQASTSYDFPGGYKRLGVNRTSVLNDDKFRKLVGGIGRNYIEAVTDSLEQDTDVEWRPRVPQWPAIGETVATAIQAALIGQAKPAEALNGAQSKLEGIMKR
jgi:multiple sugar transport system substrate-binding protein